MLPIINTRNDLDALKGTANYRQAMECLKESMVTTVDKALHPEGYGQIDYTGSEIEPVWTQIETLESIERLGFTKDKFLATCAEIGV